jgi:hypothetical protein
MVAVAIVRSTGAQVTKALARDLLVFRAKGDSVMDREKFRGEMEAGHDW